MTPLAGARRWSIRRPALSIIKAFGLPEEFAVDALEDSRGQAAGFSEKELGGREDFTGWTTITIDPVDARDFDALCYDVICEIAQLLIELQCPRLNAERSRIGCRLRVLVDDACANSELCQPQREGQARRAGAGDENLGIACSAQDVLHSRWGRQIHLSAGTHVVAWPR